ncbi:MAG: hypothetical protein KAH17_03810 [Bacteroidales bacterium]|nr:hypothetical protein [Bacteroidales bacterium]
MRKIFIIGLLFLLACQEEKPTIITPVIILDSDSFETTQTLHLQAELVSENRINIENYLVRWDWEGDGFFDTQYSSNFTATHRFDAPGDYIITLEVIDLTEHTILTKMSVNIVQGFSEPQAAFIISPETGNTKTSFLFDASQTWDAEEENELLIFSWDFDNDHRFDFVNTGNPIAEYKYPFRGDYVIRLLVTDTSGLSAETSQTLTVTHIDTLIKPIITFTPDYPTDWDTIRFDASGSIYQGDPDMPFHYSFKEQNGYWKEAGDSGIYYWARPLTGISILKVRVYNPEDFYQEKEVLIQVTKGDRPPYASFLRSSRFGNVNSSFFFDAWGSSDKEDMPSELRVKWDFDGDGSWDTQYSNDKYAEWTYTQPGIYMAKLKVQDTKGGIDEIEQDIHISQYGNRTSYVYDERSALYYGTVLIGNRWWMGQNLRFNPNNDTIPGRGLTWCYNDNAYACWATGKLYRASWVLESWNGTLAHNNICPGGWRLPSALEWQELVEVFGADQAGKNLYYGGKSDFNALYGGYAGYHIYGQFIDFEMDSIYKTAVFMTSSINGSKLKVFQLKKDSAKVERRDMVIDGYYSVRCIKKED